jgi:alkaline phosphatase D
MLSPRARRGNTLVTHGASWRSRVPFVIDPNQGISRRRFVAGAGMGAGALILGGVPVGAGAGRKRVPFARGGNFAQGVAAGEPGTRGMTLWTRLEGIRADRRITVEVARDDDFRRVVFRRNVIARASEDGTVKMRVQRGLKPGERYFYRFETRTTDSRVGTFDTLRPADSNEPVRIAFFSCQDYQAGYYGAHDAIAREDVDLVVCLGDYIYEKNFYDGPRKDTTGANGDGEVMTLGEYRSKYRLYRDDADLQSMHAAHPFIGIWDDHEVEDNYAGDRPGDAAGDRRDVAFKRRQFNGYRAYFEYMPFRRPVRKDTPNYRTIPLGSAAELFLLDERQYRDDQPCDDQFFVPCPEAEAPGRTLLGEGQKEWLKAGLEKSGAAWKLIGNQLMIMSLDSAPGAPINKDQWDGYGAERREILQHVADRGIKDVSFITGDIHTFFAGDVGVDGRGPESVATEFVGGSITSLGIPEIVQGTSGLPLTTDQAILLSGRLREVNPHLRYDEQKSRGYGVLTATPEELRVEFKAVDAMQRSTEARTIGSFRVPRGDPRVQVV